jgi:hypothetical protein
LPDSQEYVELGKLSYWFNDDNCRNFLRKLAASKGFDPLVPDNWDTIQLKDVKEAGVCLLLLLFHNNGNDN